MKSPITDKRGFSLMEMLIYIAILVLIMVVVINILFNIISSQKKFKTAKNVENSAAYTLERINREIRDAQSIDTLGSVFGSNPGSLKLIGTDVNGNSKTVEFFVSSSTVHIKENGIDLGRLSQTEGRVTNLIFNRITNTHSDSVRTRLTVESGTSTNYRSENFYSTTILRGSL
jgi:prepilin-type N-terminal cleavage/methylation domain-containing protein